MQCFTRSSAHRSFSQNDFPGWLKSSRSTRGPTKALFCRKNDSAICLTHDELTRMLRLRRCGGKEQSHLLSATGLWSHLL